MPTWARNAITFGLPAIAFVAGSLSNGFQALSSVATRADVREVRAESFAYTDKQIAVTAAELKAYSDGNRKQTLLDLKDELAKLGNAQTDTRARVEEILRRLPKGN